MSKELTFADFAVMFRLGPNKITMGKEDAARLAELVQKSSDELKRLRALVEETGTEVKKLRAALLLARVAVSHACELSDRILYTQDLVRIDAALGEKE
jgi:hypothetical protein